MVRHKTESHSAMNTFSLVAVSAALTVLPIIVVLAAAAALFIGRRMVRG